MGALLQLAIPLSEVGEHQLSLGILVSHRNMGTSSLKCSGGCTCDMQSFDAHHSQDTSVQALQQFNVTCMDVVAPCLLNICTLNATSSSGHAFKVLSLGLADGQLSALDIRTLSG